MNQFYLHDGIRFYFQEIGSGLPVVFCHGLGGDLEAPKELLNEPDGFRLIVWDSRGHGGTEPLGPEEKLSFSSMVDDLTALLDHLKIQEAVIGGISMGAGVAAQFALRHVSRARALVLVRPAWLDQSLPENLALFPRIADMLKTRDPELGRTEFLKLPEVVAMQRICPRAVDSLADQFRKPAAVERRSRLHKIPEDRPITSWNGVEGLDMPALVVGVPQDPLHPLDIALTWARRLRRVQFASIPSKYESPQQHASEFRQYFHQFLESLVS